MPVNNFVGGESFCRRPTRGAPDGAAPWGCADMPIWSYLGRYARPRALETWPCITRLECSWPLNRKRREFQILVKDQISSRFPYITPCVQVISSCSHTSPSDEGDKRHPAVNRITPLTRGGSLYIMVSKTVNSLISMFIVLYYLLQLTYLNR